jgi:hypothetical protein
MPDSYRSIWSRHRFSRLTKPPISASSEKYCRRIGPRLLRRPDTMAAIATWKMIAFPGAHYDYRDWVDDTTSAIPALMDGMHSPQRNRDTDADRRVRRWRHICQRTILSSSARPEPLDHRRISPRELDPSRAARRGLHLGVRTARARRIAMLHRVTVPDYVRAALRHLEGTNDAGFTPKFLILSSWQAREDAADTATQGEDRMESHAPRHPVLASGREVLPARDAGSGQARLRGAEDWPVSGHAHAFTLPSDQSAEAARAL